MLAGHISYCHGAVRLDTTKCIPEIVGPFSYRNVPFDGNENCQTNLA